jgi:hypothetical protein
MFRKQHLIGKSKKKKAAMREEDNLRNMAVAIKGEIENK